MRRRPILWTVLLVLGLALALAAGVLAGPAPLSLGRILDAWHPGGDPLAREILFQIRLPRVAAAALTGAGLAVSGALFQALLRNPLAEPYLLGVSSGAAFGAVAFLTLGLGTGPWFLTLAALAGSLLAIGIVFRVARVAGRLDTRVLILAGVVVAAFFGACVMLLLSLAQGEAFRSGVLWTMGSFSSISWGMIAALGSYTIPALVFSFGISRHLNALAMGEEVAAHLGTEVERLKGISFLVASLLAAAAVSVAGVIGFVGLVVPHAARLIWGADHRRLLPVSCLGGAALLVAADTAARTVVRPLELPVGVVTAIVGVPLFLVLLRKSHP